MDSLLAQVAEGGTPGLDRFVEAFGDTLPLLQALRDTPQDPEWHGEGDVYTHTALVLDETYELLARSGAHLEPERRLGLVLAAVLHDVAKPLTTRVENVNGADRLVAPRHADRGRSYLAYRLLDLGLPYETARQVLALVGHHHDPKWLVIKERPLRDYRRLARLADLELLYYLEQADMRGRRCSDRQRQIDLIELFRLFAEEYGVWSSATPYQEWQLCIESELAGNEREARELVLATAIQEAEAGIIATPYEAVARSYRYRQGWASLVVMCGPSGAGKSSWIRNHLPDYHVVSLDDLRENIAGDRDDQSKNGQVMQAAKEQLKGHLRRHEKVVWDATGLRRDFRTAVCQLGFDYHAHVTLVVFHMPEREFFARNEARGMGVPRQVLRQQLDRLEWPYATEAHHIVYVDGDGRTVAVEGT